MCIYPSCKVQPTYNTEGETKALYCSIHKLEGMVDVKDTTCKNDWCLTHFHEDVMGIVYFVMSICFLTNQ